MDSQGRLSRTPSRREASSAFWGGGRSEENTITRRNFGPRVGAIDLIVSAAGYGPGTGCARGPHFKQAGMKGGHTAGHTQGFAGKVSGSRKNFPAGEEG